MKNIVDYLKETGGKYVHDVIGREFELTLARNYLICKFNEKGLWWRLTPHIDPSYVIQFELEKYGIEIRFCEECGKPYDAGYMADGGDWYCCEDCFEEAMDNTYGKGKWRGSKEEGKYGGWYEYLNDDGEWEDTSVFYTEWY